MESQNIIGQRRLRLPQNVEAPRCSVVRRRRHGLALVLLAFSWAAGSSHTLPAQQPEFIDREPEIKAAYLYNFGRYVEWPAETHAKGSGREREFVIGVVGDTPVGTPLAKIAAGKKLNGRTIVIRRFRAVADFKECQLLFVPTGQDRSLAAGLLKKARATATLIVGEDKDFALQEGHIGLYVDDNSVKFEINSATAEKAGLKISSKLLSVGKLVGQKPGK